MKAIESKDMRERGRKIDAILNQFPHLNEEMRESLEVEKKRSDIHRAVESALGMRLNVSTEGSPKNAAAFVPTSNIRGKKREAYMTWSTLDNKDWALHAARHELNHIKSGFTAIEMEEELTKEQIEALQQELSIQEKDEIFWLEGFNELTTIKEVGKDPNCGYNNAEVPAAQKLEEVCIRLTGESLVEAYRARDKIMFYNRLRKACDMLLAEKISAMLMQKAA